MTSRYRYRLRPLTDPPEIVEMEAGPFAPSDASLFGQAEAAKRAMLTGRAWVCDYEEIVDAPTPPGFPFKLALVAITLTLLGGAIGVTWRLGERANEICRDRALSSTNVSLCSGEVYALNMLGEIECGCRP